MEQQVDPHRLPSQPSKHFRDRIIYQSVQHTIPHGIILKALEIPSYTHITSIGIFPKVAPTLNALHGHLQNVDAVDWLKKTGIYLVEQAKELVQTFTNTIIDQIPKNPFFLGIDQTYKQQFSPKNQLTIDEQKQYYLKWQQASQTQSCFIIIHMAEELFLVGWGDPTGKDYKGIKIYNRQGFSAVQMGIWKAGFPVNNLLVKFANDNTPVEVYLRRFQGKKLVTGQLRYLLDSQIHIYKEGNSTIVYPN